MGKASKGYGGRRASWEVFMQSADDDGIRPHSRKKSDRGKRKLVSVPRLHCIVLDGK